MRWITTQKNSYVVLSNTGKLYHGEIGFPLKQVMDNVDAGMLLSFSLTTRMFLCPIVHVLMFYISM